MLVAVMPYEDVPKVPVAPKPTTAKPAGTKASSAKSKPATPDWSTWMPGPDWKQNRPEGVYTVQELFEGTGCKLLQLLCAHMHISLLTHGHAECHSHNSGCYHVTGDMALP